jgi:streptogramin lyase
VGLLSAAAPAAASTTIPTSAGSPIPKPEMAAATPSGTVVGIGSDGAEGVWFSDRENVKGQVTAYLTHYSPTKIGLTRVNLKPPSPESGIVWGIAPGLNGQEWFAREEENQLSHITATGAVSNKTLPQPAVPHDVAVDNQGNVWFTERNGNSLGCGLGRLSPTGHLTQYFGVGGGDCYDLTVGPDGNIWIAGYSANVVQEVSAITGALLASYSVRLPAGIATSGGYVWVTEVEPSRVASISPTGEVVEYVLPGERSLEWMTAGPDGAVWFMENDGPVSGVGGIGRLAPGGSFSEIGLGAGNWPADVTATSHAVYLTQSGSSPGILRIPLSGFVQPEPMYAALGDSFSSGEGNPPYEPASDNPSTPDTCHRSEAAYGPRLDRDLALGGMTFKACSGAVTNDFFDINHKDPSEPKQLSWLSAKTKTVTLTIGGDDAGFVRILEHCVAGPRGSWPFGQSYGCSKDKTLAEETQTRLNALAGTVSGSTPSGQQIRPLSEVLGAIHADAPNARIVIGGYPHLFGASKTTYEEDLLAPGGRTCRVGSAVILGQEERFYVSYGDAQWLNSLGNKLDTIISGAVTSAKEHGIPVSYAPPTHFLTHGLCDTAESWINPLTISADDKPEASSFHPTSNGQRLGYEAAFAEKLK